MANIDPQMAEIIQNAITTAKTTPQGRALLEKIMPALLQVESGGNPNARNTASGAQGIAQMLPATAKEFGVKNPMDPQQEIPGAVNKMAGLLDQYKDKPNQALQAWHQGQGNMARNPAGGPQTQDFVRKVDQGAGLAPSSPQAGISPNPGLQNQLSSAEIQAAQSLSSDQQALQSNEKAMGAEGEGILGQMQKTIGDIPKYTPEPLPTWKPTSPPVDAKDFQSLSDGLLLLGAVFGARGGSTGFQAAAESMNGILQGYLTGNLDKAKAQREEFDSQYKAAMDRAKEARDEFSASLTVPNLTLGMMQNRMDFIKAKYGMMSTGINNDAKNILKNLQDTQQALLGVDRADTLRQSVIDRQLNSSLDRAVKMQEFSTKLGQVLPIPAAENKVLSSGVQALTILTDLRSQVRDNPELLDTYKRYFPDAQAIQANFKAGQYPFEDSIRTMQEQGVDEQQIQFFRDLGTAVLDLASTTGSRAFNMVQFINSLKPQPGDDPALVLTGLNHFYDTTKQSLVLNSSQYINNPKYRPDLAALFTQAGLDMNDLQGDMAPIERPAHPEAVPANKPGKPVKLSNGWSVTESN